MARTPVLVLLIGAGLATLSAEAARLPGAAATAATMQVQQSKELAAPRRVLQDTSVFGFMYDRGEPLVDLEDPKFPYFGGDQKNPNTVIYADCSHQDPATPACKDYCNKDTVGQSCKGGTSDCWYCRDIQAPALPLCANQPGSSVFGFLYDRGEPILDMEDPKIPYYAGDPKRPNTVIYHDCSYLVGEFALPACKDYCNKDTVGQGCDGGNGDCWYCRGSCDMGTQ